MHSMGVGSAGVVFSSIVIKFLTRVGCLYDAQSQAVSPCPATDRWHTSQRETQVCMVRPCYARCMLGVGVGWVGEVRERGAGGVGG